MDTHTIKTNNNLLALAERAGAKFRRSGNGFSSCCPIHNGDNPTAFHAYIGDDGYQHFKCFTREECNQYGSDIISLYRVLNNCDFKTACEALGGDSSSMAIAQRYAEPTAPLTYDPPAEVWQARAMQWIKAAESALWDSRGVEALAWLQARGLRDETIRAARLGYIPAYKEDKADLWGKPDDNPDPIKFSGKSILIPGLVAGSVWYLKMRLLSPKDPKRKYLGVRGNKPAALYGADFITQGKPAVFCEGEFDALLLRQELKDLASVMTLGSAGNELNLTTWGLYLFRPSCFVIGYDTDKAGSRGKNKLSWLHDAQLINIPALREGDKDFTDFHMSGGNLYSLIESAVREDAPIFVNWLEGVKPATIRGQYWENPDRRIEAYYLPSELDQCLNLMRITS